MDLKMLARPGFGLPELGTCTLPCVGSAHANVIPNGGGTVANRSSTVAALGLLITFMCMAHLDSASGE